MNENTYREQNKCPMCEGKGEVFNPAGPNVKCICEDGTYIGHLLNWEMMLLEIKIERLSEERNDLLFWIQQHNNCSTCHSDRSKTLGGIPCKECGLIGTQPWPG